MGTAISISVHPVHDVIAPLCRSTKPRRVRIERAKRLLDGTVPVFGGSAMEYDRVQGPIETFALPQGLMVRPS